jgi:hypothetical protein
MDSKQGFRYRRLTIALEQDHKELLRQVWILRMLILHGDRYDNETIENRLIELESFLEKHSRNETYEIREILAETRPSLSTMNDERLTAVVASINNLLSWTGGSYMAFQELERSLSQHAKDVEDLLLSLPGVVTEEGTHEQRESIDKEGKLLVIS